METTDRTKQKLTLVTRTFHFDRLGIETLQSQTTEKRGETVHCNNIDCRGAPPPRSVPSKQPNQKFLFFIRWSQMFKGLGHHDDLEYDHEQLFEQENRCRETGVPTNSFTMGPNTNTPRPPHRTGFSTCWPRSAATHMQTNGPT